ncbi:MAG: S9 family peptidase, partial [Bacteroidales bacterium]
MKKITVTLLVLIVATAAFSQKKPLDHSVYDAWKSVGSISMSDDGKFIAYTIREQEGDRYVEILNTKTLEKKPVQRAERSALTPDGTYLIASIKPFFAETKDAQRKKLKPDQMPKDTLGIYNCHTGELVKYPFLESFKKGLYGNKYIAYKTKMPADTTKGKEPAKKDKKAGS